MTEQTPLEETFNLPPIDETKIQDLKLDLTNLTALDNQITVNVGGIDPLIEADAELDALHDKAVEGYDSLMDVGMNHPPGTAPGIFEAAVKLLGHAITAKTNKIDKKLKVMGLELKRQQLAGKGELDTDPMIPGNARTLDRNEILRLLNNKETK